MINALIEPHAALIDQCFFFLQCGCWVATAFLFFFSHCPVFSTLRTLMDTKLLLSWRPPQNWTETLQLSYPYFPLEMVLEQVKTFFFLPLAHIFLFLNHTSISRVISLLGWLMNTFKAPFFKATDAFGGQGTWEFPQWCYHSNMSPFWWLSVTHLGFLIAATYWCCIHFFSWKCQIVSSHYVWNHRQPFVVMISKDTCKGISEPMQASRSKSLMLNEYSLVCV